MSQRSSRACRKQHALPCAPAQRSHPFAETVRVYAHALVASRSILNTVVTSQTQSMASDTSCSIRFIRAGANEVSVAAVSISAGRTSM